MAFGNPIRSIVPGFAALACAGAFSSADVNAEEIRYLRDEVSPVVYPETVRAAGESDVRLIEPTSPILGKNLVAAIRADSRVPEQILESIQRDYPEWKSDLRISASAYFQTMMPGLRDYCSQNTVATAGQWTQVEPAAIPLENLIPVHDDYVAQMEQTNQEYSEGRIDDEGLERRARELANEFQQIRDRCPVVLKIEKIEGVAQAILAGRMDDLVVLNHTVSSPEAAWPRTQFSINGFTQYVYNELIAYPRLRLLLKSLYEAQVEWLALKSIGGTDSRFLAYVQQKLLSEGFPGQKILLAMAYSTRNMPSLDIQYGRDTQRVLELEVYFWKFREIRQTMLENRLPEIFPNHVFARNPGVYHYLTGALLGCEVYNHGYHVGTALMMAYLSKLAYKSHKYIAEIRAAEGLNFEKARKIARDQGFSTGLDAGKYGGRNGVEVCILSDRYERQRRGAEIDASIGALRAELEEWSVRRSSHEISRRHFLRERNRINARISALERERRELQRGRNLNRE